MHCRVLLFIAIITTCVATASEELRPLPRVTVFHYDANSHDSLFNALAAVPMNVFHYQGKVYQSPLVADDLTVETITYLLEDYKTYLAGHDGVQWLEVVGPVPAGVEAQIRTLLGLTAAQVSHINGDPIGLAAEIATHDWVSSQYVVIAPYDNNPTETHYESAAAAAAIASDLNAPLLYIYANSLPLTTSGVISNLGATKVVIVDYGNVISPGVVSSLQGLGLTISGNLKTTAEVIAYMKSRSNQVTLCQAWNTWELLAAAYGGGVYHGAVFFYEAFAAGNSANEAAEFIKSYPWSPFKSDAPMPPRLPSLEQDTWDNFHSWMLSVGAEDTTKLETVLTFATQTYPTYVLDRSILGDPNQPNQPGCYAGRFPLEPRMNLCMINHTTMYRALAFANPRRNKANFAGVCYLAGNSGPGPEYFINSLGQQHLVNEFYGGGHWGDSSEPGVFQSLQDDGGDMMLHNGYNAGTGTDPMFGYPLNGFIQEINTGCNFFYYSGHGDINQIMAFAEDGGIRQDCTYGSTYWPLQAGAITTGGGHFYASQVLASFENVHGISAMFNACLLSAPGSTFDEAWLQKGAAMTIGSYVSVGWNNAAYFACHYLQGITAQNKPLGEAFGNAQVLASAIFPLGQLSPEPDTLRFVMVGDPNMTYNQPNWTSPVPSALAQNYGGHKPCNVVGIEFTSLDTSSTSDRINITWAVADETGSVGYNIYRRTAGEKRWNRLNASIISPGAGKYCYADMTATSKLSYEYLVGNVTSDGTESMHGPVTGQLGESKPAFSLSSTAPNPVFSTTVIHYSLATGGDAKLAIYDLSGRLVKVLVENPNATAGEHQMVWDCTNSVGHQVAAGVYIYTLSAGSNHTSKRLVVAR